MAYAQGEAPRYSIDASTIPCACDLCLKRKFTQCEFLKKRGNLKRHIMVKKTAQRKNVVDVETESETPTYSLQGDKGKSTHDVRFEFKDVNDEEKE